jgi:LysR family transcriptional regulator, transcriptional activator for aaeXAB operon
MNKEPLGLAWELSVLSKCLPFPNLSVASEHVGLSQPQISRIVKRLEEELQLPLLDRQSRRHSHWTSAALRLGEEYQALHREFQSRLLELQSRSDQVKIRIGTLEGLYELASRLAHHLFEHDSTENIELNIYDLNELSEHFLEGRLDLVVTSRETGRRKFPIWRQLGYQTLDFMGPARSGLIVQSPSEEQSVSPIDDKSTRQVLVSNSLALRRFWIENYSARGRTPSPLLKTKSQAPKGAQVEPVFLVGSSQIKAGAREIIMSFDAFKETRS